MWTYYFIAMLNIITFSSVSTNSFESDNDVNTNPKWRLLVYLPAAENIVDSIENVYNEETELLRIIKLNDHNVSYLMKETKDVDERDARTHQNRHRPKETTLGKENEDYTTRKQERNEERKKHKKNMKTPSQTELVRHLAQILKKNKLVQIIRRGLDILNIDDNLNNTIKDKDLEDPCSIPGICRTQNGFAHLLHDILSLILKFEISDFYLFCQILTDVIKVTDFSDVLDHATDKCIREYVENFEMADDRAKYDLVAYALSVIDKSNDTLLGITSIEHQRRAAWQNLIYLLDDVIPKTKENLKDWNDIRTAMNNFRTGVLSYIEPTLNYLLDNLKRNLRILNEYSKRKVLESFRLVCNTFKYHKYVHGDFMLFPIDPVQKQQMEEQQNSRFIV